MDIPKPNFLQRLQAVDDRVKNKVIVGATIVFMIIILFVWLSYFNAILVGQDQSGGSGPWDSFKAQLGEAYQSFAGNMSSLGSAFGGNGYEVKPQN